MILTSAQIGYTLLIMAGFLIGFILFLRNYFHRYSNQLARQKSDLSIKIKKYQEINAFKYHLTNWLFGLACSISLVVLLFSYTKPEEMIEGVFICGEDIDNIETDIPRTYYQVVTLSLPITKILPEEKIEGEIKFLSIETDTAILDTFIEKEQITLEKIADSTTTKEPNPDIEKIFDKVELMPIFPGCENLLTEKERKKCTETKMLQFIIKNFRYPSIAKENGIRGPIVLSFAIDKDGSIIYTTLIKDIGGGVGEEGIRVINLMNEMPQKWTPGYEKGKAVKVKYMMPMRCFRFH